MNDIFAMLQEAVEKGPTWTLYQRYYLTKIRGYGSVGMPDGDLRHLSAKEGLLDSLIRHGLIERRGDNWFIPEHSLR